MFFRVRCDSMVVGRGLRAAVVVILAVVAVVVCSSSVAAQTDIYVRGSGRLFPVALPRLCVAGGDAAIAQTIPNVMARDLDLSGYFQVLDPNSFIETPGKCGDQTGVAYSDWSVIGAEGVVRGVVMPTAAGVKVQLYLHDVQRRTVVLGKEYEGEVAQAGRMAHKFANEIMRFFTGEPGVFGSSIAFTSKVGRFKDLFVMDMDGSNVRQLTDERALAVSSAWDPTGRRLVFTSYRNRVPDLFTVDVFSRTITQITRGTALELGAQFAPGGGLLASRTVGGNSDLVELNLDGTIARTVLPSRGTINVSPRFSPDGQRVAFCSNRAGGPQIYTMNADGSGIKRVSFVNSNYCTSPAWSPKGDRLAFVCRADSGFQLFTSGIDGEAPLQLTSGGDNEDPDFSPDGRYIVFASTQGHRGVFGLYLMRSDGSNMRELSRSRGGDSEPTWGPMPAW
jgi:TolB protein